MRGRTRRQHAPDRGTILAPVPAAGQPARGGTPPQYSLSYAFVPVTAHLDTQTGQTSQDGPQHQMTLAATFALHPEGQAGPEIAWQAQVAVSNGNAQVTQITEGVQAAWVMPFLNGALQVSALASAAAGVAQGRPDASGRVSMVPSAQVAAGGQVTYAIPGTNNHVLIGFQVQGSVTQTQGSNASLDFAPQGFLQIQWN